MVEPSNIVEIDARQPSPPPQASDFKGGSSLSPSGQSIGLNDQYLTRDGKPWLPVMGEFHFSRYPEAGWEEEILKMKAGGVQIVSSYIFWNHIEEVKGVFDWTGQRDLRRFAELCQKHGMYLWVRIGPWVHGESRYGGLPDWVVKESTARTTDPRFLGFVAPFYDQIGNQLKGLLWKDGGPVIGVQIENEYGGGGAQRWTCIHPPVEEDGSGRGDGRASLHRDRVERRRVAAGGSRAGLWRLPGCGMGPETREALARRGLPLPFQ